jgi:hypothetical protein
MSDCGLLLELGSFHCRGQCEFFIVKSSGQVCLWISAMTFSLLDSLSLGKSLTDSATNSLKVIVFMQEWF